MSSIAIIGAGAWGAALAHHAKRLGHTVTLHARTPGDRDGIPIATTPPTDPADAILLTTPVQHMRALLAELRPQAPILVCSKGIEASTRMLPLEILADLHPDTPAAILTGPNFAAEIAAGQPAAAIIAAADPHLRATLVTLLAGPTFRLYGNDDPTGAQLGGAAKNVIAIAAGIVIGAGLGENARAALVTRGLAELARLVAAQGGRPETVAGLSGLGDLLLTCTGPASRNFSCGLALGRGDTLPAALAASKGVVEGVTTAPALIARAAGTELPICAAVADLLAGRSTVDAAIARLMSRQLKDE